MLGPLPALYRVIVSVCAFLAFVGLGVWSAWMLPDSALASIGTGLGAGLGIVVVMLLLHDPQEPGRHSRVRVRTPRS